MNPAAPLADRMRPRTAAEVVGQAALLRHGTLLGAALTTGEVPSLVLHGPPGCGKTTLGRLLADASGRPFEALSAVTSGVKDVREVIARAKQVPGGRGVLLFVDEIHRFNRSQQDAFLPHIEDGTIVLVEREEYLRHLRGRYGFCFLIGHPSLTDSAVELVDMYRAKNEIERDFRNIKSVLELRPVHHRNDDKVKAHVTLCMLALLLLRDLEQLLTASPISAEQALETLASCHLIRMRVGTEDIYAATELNRGQENLIKLMVLRDSLDPRSLASEVTPR